LVISTFPRKRGVVRRLVILTFPLEPRVMEITGIDPRSYGGLSLLLTALRLLEYHARITA
jgi:hypothetical protein